METTTEQREAFRTAVEAISRATSMDVDGQTWKDKEAIVREVIAELDCDTSFFEFISWFDEDE